MVSSHSCQPLFSKTEESKLERAPSPSPFLGSCFDLGVKDVAGLACWIYTTFQVAWLAGGGSPPSSCLAWTWLRDKAVTRAQAATAKLHHGGGLCLTIVRPYLLTATATDGLQDSPSSSGHNCPCQGTWLLF